MMEVAQLPQPPQNLNSSVVDVGDQTVPTSAAASLRMPVSVPENQQLLMQPKAEEEEDLSSLSLVMDDSDNIDLDQNEPILYQGPIFDMGKEEDLDADDFLVNPDAGLVKGNIKEKVRGFDEEEKKICPLVDRKSAILYDIVQQLEEEQLVQSLKILKTYKKPIVFPRELLDEDEGSYVGIKIVDPEEWRKKEEDRIIEAELDEQTKVLGDLQYIHDTYREPFAHGWTREVVVRVHAAPHGAEFGTFPLTSIGEVFYRDPTGKKIRSMKQISISLEKMSAPTLSIKNFTFGKGPVGMKDQRKEIIRKIISGRSVTSVTPIRPIAKGKKVSMNNSSDMFNKGANALFNENASPAGPKMKSSSSRRSIQPPKRYATGQAYMYPEKRSKTGTKKDVEYQSDNDMEMGMLPPKYALPRSKDDFSGGGQGEEAIVKKRGRPPSKKADVKSSSDVNSGYNGDNDSTLFQISAFHNNSVGSSLFEGIENAQSDDGMYGGMGMMEAEENNTMEEMDSGMEEHHGGHQGPEELLPCSIRCPGMTGEIPTLQCKRCLCLYHPECLALPPNLNFRNFLCGNCEGEHVEDLPRSSGAGGHGMGHGGKSGATSSSEQQQPQQVQQMQKKTTPSWLPPTKSSKTTGEPVKIKKPPPPLLPAFSKLPGSKFHGNLNQKLKTMMPPGVGKMVGMLPPPSLGRGFGINNNKNSIGGKISSSSSASSSPSGMSMSMLRPQDDSMSISPITMKRGRGRPPKSSRLLPSLSNRNLTITPISIRTRLPVPNLAPMSKGTNKSMPITFLPPKMSKGNQQLQQQHQQQQQQHSNQQQHHQVLQQRLGGGLPSKGQSGRGLLPNLTGGSSAGGPVRFQDNLFKEMRRGMKSPSSQPPMPIINKGPGGFPPFKRYVQSVVSIGTKKFVAVPTRSDAGTLLNKGKGVKKSVSSPAPAVPVGSSMPGSGSSGSSVSVSVSAKPTQPQQQEQQSTQPLSTSTSPSQSQSQTNANTNASVSPDKRSSSGDVAGRGSEDLVEEGASQKTGGKVRQASPHKFDTDQKVIQQVFKYLNVKDLSRASRVSRLWNTVATNVNLWKIVRMKNHRISDVEAFTQFLKKQKTEQVDFRKMISADEMNWDKLFETLCNIPSLKQIILGPRTLSSDRVSSLSQHCPNIEIVTS